MPKSASAQNRLTRSDEGFISMIKNLKKESFFSPETSAIVVARREPQPQFPRHRHQFSELVIVTAGTGLHAIRKEEYSVGAGDVFVISDNSPHEYKDMKDLALINILYDANELGMKKWDVRTLPGYHAMFTFEPTYRRKHKFESRLRLSIDELAHVKSTVESLENELNGRRPGYRLMARSIFAQLICHLSRCYGQSSQDSSRALLRIGKAISHIEDNISVDLDLDSLSAIAHMSRRNFTRAFRNAIGHSPIEYLIRLRISRAMELLTHSEINITETAFQTGFLDSNYFSRQFRKVAGISPSEYKKRYSA